MTGVIDLIHATVRLEQPLGNGQATVGTGFIVAASSPDGTPRTVLITANHVFANMPHDKAKVGLRRLDERGDWRFTPISIRIRNAEGEPTWTRHPTQDIAAIELPPKTAPAAVPVGELPGERALEALRVKPGDEMMVLGYPRGYSANTAGFPVLRSGRVASFPLSPAEKYPTYLLDFSVFSGNSGGPVYIVGRKESGKGAPRVVVTGLLTQQIKINGDRLAIGNVTQADFISEAVSLMGVSRPAEVTAASSVLPTSDGPQPASSRPSPTPSERLGEAWEAFVQDLKILIRRAWIVTRDRWIDLTTPDPKRA